MAPPKTRNPNEIVKCSKCDLVLSRRGDLARHMKKHSENKDALSHHCPYEGCTYSSIQRSNVDTHYRTHTQDKNQVCPECDKGFVDPGSLIRHRKRKHGYVPKARKTRQAPASAPSASTSQVASTSQAPSTSASAAAAHRTSRRARADPYPRSVSVSSLSSSESSSSNASSPEPSVPSFHVFISQPSVPIEQFRSSFHKFAVVKPKEEDIIEVGESYFWSMKEAERIVRSPSPKGLHGGVETGRHMEGVGLHPQCEPLGWEVGYDWNVFCNAETQMQTTTPSSTQYQSNLISPSYTFPEFESFFNDAVTSAQELEQWNLTAPPLDAVEIKMECDLVAPQPRRANCGPWPEHLLDFPSSESTQDSSLHSLLDDLPPSAYAPPPVEDFASLFQFLDPHSPSSDYSSDSSLYRS